MNKFKEQFVQNYQNIINNYSKVQTHLTTYFANVFDFEIKNLKLLLKTITNDNIPSFDAIFDLKIDNEILIKELIFRDLSWGSPTCYICFLDNKKLFLSLEKDYWRGNEFITSDLDLYKLLILEASKQFVFKPNIQE